MDFEAILGNEIIVCENNIKKKILSYLDNTSKIYNIKFLTFDDVIKGLYFDYDKKAIYHLMKTYSITYEVAEMYIKNIYYISENEYKNKLDDLVKYKKELESAGLLKKDNLFIQLIKDKKIIIVKKNISKYDSYIIEKLKEYSNVTIYNFSYKKYEHKIYEFDTLEKEVEYVAYSICELISQGIDITKIKISNIDSDYISTVKRIFGYFNIPINLPNSSYLIGTKIASDFIKNYDSDINRTFESIKKYSGENTYNQILDICNKYSFIDDYMAVKDMIVKDLSDTLVSKDKIKDAIEVCDYNDIFEDEYVFLLNFNLKSIPKVYKDEDYISDNIKPPYLDTTLDKNIQIKNETINSISSIKNLVITYKLMTPMSECYPSNLVNKEKVERPILDIYKSYSSLNDKLKLAAYLDKLYKYGVKEKDVDVLKYNYDIPYLKYDNRYTKVDIRSLYKLTSNRLSFSYTNVEQYYECAFKYYLANILKLNIYEENFQAIIGTVFHHILEIGIDKDIDVDHEISNFLSEKYSNRVFSKKETFFIKKAGENIKFVLDVIKKQMQFCKLNGIQKEKRVFISKDKNVKITFTGVIDKLLYEEYDDKTVVAIIDYKTGNSVDIDLGYMKDGIGLQLPIYLLLAKNMEFKNIKFAGIYLQKVLPDIEKAGDKLTREDKLKLEGYTTSDKDILKDFDITYPDSSFIKGLKLTQAGTFSSKKVISPDTFDFLASLADQKIDECIDNVLSSKFDINPIKKASESDIAGCQYCNFKDICFRTYRDIKTISKDTGGEEDE